MRWTESDAAAPETRHFRTRRCIVGSAGGKFISILVISTNLNDV